jgi:hypothetical protein
MTSHHHRSLFRAEKKNMRLVMPYVVTIFLFLGSAVISVSGCGENNRRSPSQEVKEFFMAGKEAQYLALQCPASGSADLSAYDHLTGVKYPPTFQVEVLREPPSKPHKSLAVLEYDPAPHAKPEEVVEGLKGKAREIGADAIILCHSVADQKLHGITAKGKMQAVAIKYLDEDVK